MKLIINYFFIFLLFLTSYCAAQKPENPRLLITTDIGGDPDDQQSLVRLMVYAKEFEIEGLISSAAGTPGELGKEIIRPELIEEIIRGYKQVYPNLLKHDKRYPAPEKLLSVVKKGNHKRGWNYVGKGFDTEGSEWIIRCVDKNDKRPLNICIFGGQTDLAQALWKVKNTRSEKEYQKFISKIRVYDINDQDHIFSNIRENHPAMFYILAKAPEGADKREGAYRGVYLGGDEHLTSLEWLKQYVIQNHGALGPLYPLKTWTAPNPHGVMKEGDTPSWFFFLNNGLNIPTQPELGGWGGRFILNERGYYSDAVDSFVNEKNARATVFRWRADFQNDWAARMDWCVNDFAACNHAPQVSVNQSKGTPLLTITARKGEIITLDATRSTDPDGNSISFEWFFYPDNGFEPFISATKEAIAQIRVPDLKKGGYIPVVLRVSDNGTPQLVSYKRILIVNP
jgi:hypothetical protein